MKFSEVQAVSVTAFCIVSAAGCPGEGKTFIVFELKVKKLSGAFYSTDLLPAVLFSFPALSF